MSLRVSLDQLTDGVRHDCRFGNIPLAGISDWMKRSRKQSIIIHFSDSLIQKLCDQNLHIHFYNNCIPLSHKPKQTFHHLSSFCLVFDNNERGSDYILIHLTFLPVLIVSYFKNYCQSYHQVAFPCFLLIFIYFYFYSVCTVAWHAWISVHQQKRMLNPLELSFQLLATMWM